jgi:hypothetical protein
MVFAMPLVAVTALMSSSANRDVGAPVIVDIVRARFESSAPHPSSGDADPVLWGRVLELLPVRPTRIVILDAASLSPAGRWRVRKLEAFVLDGDSTVYVLRQAMTLRQAEGGDAFDRLMLASVVLHELSHVHGLDEAGALGAEVTFWRRLVAAGRVDVALGMTYAQKLGDERRQLLARVRPPTPSRSRSSAGTRSGR